ncbi:MAG: hypothetical protein LBN74_08055 [Prevotella sp.]|jgi:hypothetical protein|nr:hypothetical protein [Prevotella sp.]
MSFIDYIKGQRKGADAHRIEKDSMTDPFMYEAIEGFDSIDDNHTERIKDIQKRLNIKSKTIKRRQPIWQSVAACAVVVFGIAGYMIIGYHDSNDLHAQDMVGNTIINIYVPEEYYVENIAAIAMHNTETAKMHKPNISQFRVDANTDTSIEEELDMLSDKSNQMMDVYAPEDFKDEANPSGSIQKGKPEPVGGYEKYNQYLKNALRRPTDDSCKDRKGKVAVEFSVNENGQPFLFEVIYSLCGTCDNEAVRLIQSGPKWIPGTERASVRVIF